MLGQILVEGSSSAAGVGDETYTGGYAGRIFRHFQPYNDHWRAQRLAGGTTVTPPTGPGYVYVHLNGKIDNTLPVYAPHFQNHLNEAHDIVQSYTGIMRTVGLFAVGGYIDHIQDTAGRTGALRIWEQSLKMLREVCEKNEVRPLAFGLPEYRRGATFYNGVAPDRALARDQCSITNELLREWGIPYAPFEAIVGDDWDACIAPDRRHPNTLGHERIAAHFIPLIGKELEIAS